MREVQLKDAKASFSAVVDQAAQGKPSLITVEFLKRGEGTELVLTHSRFATVESRDNHARGWGRGLESFAKFVEGLS